MVLISFKDLNGKNLEEVKIEGLSSLKSLTLSFQSSNEVILTNLLALRKLQLHLETTINSEILLKLIENLPYIEVLHLGGDLSYFNLDSLYNLKEIDLTGRIMDDFNVHLFDNLCNQLESISFSFINIDDKCLEKLFYGRNFPYLSKFKITDSLENINLDKKFFDGFRMLKNLIISNNKNLRIIDTDAFSNLIELQKFILSNTCIEFLDNTMFSNLINLKKLSLHDNQIGAIEENSFSNLNSLENLTLNLNQLSSLSAKSFIGLDNLKHLNLRSNKLVSFDLEIFDNIGKIKEIYLEGNPIMNKDEILNRSLQSNIKVKLS